MKVFKCNICGNVVELINEGGGELVCCGEPMEEMIPKTTEEGNEKHLPVVEATGNTVEVKVGSVEHPMLEGHHIEWIIIKYNNKYQKLKLFPSDKPYAKFNIDEEYTTLEVYEYCNIHGLWKTVFNK